MPSVKRGMLTDEDRQLVVLANRERLPLIVATLHACIFKPGERGLRQLPCKEPDLLLGIPVDWDNLKMRLAHPGYTKSADVPWLSAVRVYRPDQAPPEDEIWRTIEAYARGTVQQVHP